MESSFIFSYVIKVNSLRVEAYKKMHYNISGASVRESGLSTARNSLIFYPIIKITYPPKKIGVNDSVANSNKFIEFILSFILSAIEDIIEIEKLLKMLL